MSPWGRAFFAGVEQTLEEHVNEAEKQFTSLKRMINNITLEERCNPNLIAKAMAGPHFPWHVASGMPFTHRAGQAAKVRNAFKRPGPLVCDGPSQGSARMSSAASRREHGLACANGLTAAAYCERGTPHRAGRDQHDRLLRRHALRDAIPVQDDEDGHRWGHSTSSHATACDS